VHDGISSCESCVPKTAPADHHRRNLHPSWDRCCSAQHIPARDSCVKATYSYTRTCVCNTLSGYFRCCFKEMQVFQKHLTFPFNLCIWHSHRARSQAHSHTHTYLQLLRQNNEAQPWHSKCNDLHFSESDREARLQVRQHCVCDGANRRGARVCSTRFRNLPPGVYGVSVTASRGVRASAVWDDKRQGSVTEFKEETRSDPDKLMHIHVPSQCTPRCSHRLIQRALPMLLTMRMHEHHQTTHLSINVFT
jgi:hypothetical protein